MSFITARNTPVFALLLSAGLLCGAWFFQYVLGYAPCTMCYWQRDAHKIVLLVAVIGLALAAAGRRQDRLFALLLTLALLGSFAMAFWHMGVEYKWWEGPQTCAAGTGAAIDYSELTMAEINAAMSKAQPPACSDSPWPDSPISMAGLNALASLFGALVCALALMRGDNV